MEELKEVDFVEIDRQQKEWLSQPYPSYGKVVWNKRREVIELYVYPSGGSYDIEIERCQTTAQVTNWIFHLMEKRWSNEIMHDLLKMFLKVLPNKILFSN